MKNFLTVITAIALFGLIACEGPAGPAGKDGASGKEGAAGKDAGFVYFEGFKENLKCGTCHTPDTDTLYHKSAITFQWASSKHANGGTSFENSTTCAVCHTTEGFVQSQNGSTVTVANNSTPVGCFACHSPHKNGNFALRTSSPATILSNLTGVANYTFDYGKGNLCAQCHKPRSQAVMLDPSKSTSTDAVNDSIRITSGRWYSHYGVQTQMLMGKGGYEWSNAPVTVSNSFHTTSTGVKTDGCTICHMPNARGDYDGGHSMKLESDEGQNLNGCKTSGCHATITSLDYKGAMTTTHANLDTLKVLLATAGWLDTLTMQAKATSTKPLVIKPSQKAGALWNFFLVEHDLSSGVHNTAYANALLRNSIAKMRGQF
ncbi:MAG: ammonia-forming cytochrome c nitrite reductase subunit c552 [Bacteroidota bacterium]